MLDVSCQFSTELFHHIFFFFYIVLNCELVARWVRLVGEQLTLCNIKLPHSFNRFQMQRCKLTIKECVTLTSRRSPWRNASEWRAKAVTKRLSVWFWERPVMFLAAWSRTSEWWSRCLLFRSVFFLCVSFKAAEMVEDEVDPDSQSWGGTRGETRMN